MTFVLCHTDTVQHLFTVTLQTCGGTISDWLVVEHYSLHWTRIRLWRDCCSLVTMCLPTCFGLLVCNLACAVVPFMFADVSKILSVSVFVSQMVVVVQFSHMHFFTFVGPSFQTRFAITLFVSDFFTSSFVSSFFKILEFWRNSLFLIIWVI